jgi:hypothetical protein
VGKKGLDPHAEGRWEAEVGNNLDSMLNVYVIKETLYIK